MSSYDAMIASVSGMSAHSNYMANIGQNISNVNTVGYKNVTTRFESMVDQPNYTQVAAGGVTMSSVIRATQQGTFQSTSSPTDLAVSGKGFFVVSDSSGKTYLTRAGSFVPDANGNLVNTAGYYLMGYGPSGVNAQSSSTLTGMQIVNVGAATPASSVTVRSNGALSYQLANGTTVTPYNIPLASVPSPDNLAANTGNVFSLTAESGEASINAAGTSGFGSIQSGQLEQSTVDVATQLTNLIVAQNGYQSNGQTLKTSTDMLKTLTELQIE